MKRVQILLDADLDAALEHQAQREGESKSALVRRLLRARLEPLPPLTEDPLHSMAGADEFDPEPVDEVVYG